MIPAQGWLPIPQGQPLDGFDLPEAATGTYREGGVLVIDEPAGFPTVTSRTIGDVAASIETGYDVDDVDTLLLTLTKSDVFTVLLVDSFFAEDLETICFPDTSEPVPDPEGFVCSGVSADTPVFTVPADPTPMILDDACIPEA